jgi:hypothetical protein
MTKLLWDIETIRFFETGIDRGVLYLADNSGVAWNGLTGFTKETGDDELTALYFDDAKYMDDPTLSAFGGTLTAYTYPDEFLTFLGTEQVQPGRYLTNQGNKSFSLSYRTLVGNDTNGVNNAYRIHILYDLVAVPSERSFSTVADTTEPIEFEWSVKSVPQPVTGYKATSHVIIDSRYVNSAALIRIEDALYGTSSTAASLPTIDALLALASATVPAQVVLGVCFISNSLTYGTTPGEVTLQWAAPSNGGVPITGYKIEGKPTASGTWTTINANYAGGLSLAVTTYDGITGLVIGTSYDFRVSAINSIGTGATSTPTTKIPVTYANVPTGLTTTPAAGSVSVAFTAPVNTGGLAITDYYMEYKTTASGTWIPYTDGVSTTPTINVTGLTNGTSYDFRVSTITSIGYGSPSATATATPSGGSGVSPTIRGFAYRDFGTLVSTTTTIDPASTTTASGGFTVKPNGGDLLILVASSDISSKTIIPPMGMAGWTLVSAMSKTGNQFQYDVYTRVAGGSAGSVTTDTAYTLNSGLATWRGALWCFAMSGATAVDSSAWAYSANAAASGTLTAPSITATVNNTILIVASIVYNVITLSQSFGTTVRSTINMGGSYGYMVASQPITSSGATGTNSISYTHTVGSTALEGFTMGVR